MKVLVIGSGLAGVTTAYYLQQSGAEVIVIDRALAPARETSFANAAMLTPSLADPWNAPGVLTQMLKSLGREDAALLLRPRALPSLVNWGWQFLRQSAPARFQENLLANARLSLFSLASFDALLARELLDFDHAACGTLKVFRDRAALDRALRIAHFLKQAPLEHQAQDRDGLVALEPALAPVAAELVGGLFYPGDQVGDPRKFCEALKRILEDRGVQFRFSEAVRGVERSGSHITGIVTPRERIAVDAYVLAAGADSPLLAKLLGFRLPIRPVKGYSLTVPVPDGFGRPRLPVLDDSLHAAVVPLGDALRVAGTAELAGYDKSLREQRIDNLKSLLQRIYPALPLDDDDLSPWTGLRPMTPDGRPLLGGSPLANLFLNTGHGHLGWTMACGSARAVAAMVLGQAPALDLAPYRYDRL